MSLSGLVFFRKKSFKSALDSLDLVKFVMCTLETRVHMTLYILTEVYKVSENYGTHSKHKFFKLSTNSDHFWPFFWTEVTFHLLIFFLYSYKIILNLWNLFFWSGSIPSHILSLNNTYWDWRGYDVDQDKKDQFSLLPKFIIQIVGFSQIIQRSMNGKIDETIKYYDNSVL